MTVTSSGSFGVWARSKIVLTVNTATMARSTAGAMVHITSSRGAPWICLGMSFSWPFLRPNFTMMKSVTAKTMTSTMPAMTNTGTARL